MTDPRDETFPPAPARRWGPWVALVVVVSGLLGHFKIVEPDVFWHLKTGQVVLETGRLVRTNLFSAIHPDYPWHNLEWLHQVALAAVYNAGGWGAVAALKTALIAATAGVLFFTMLRRAPLPGLAAALTLVAVAGIRFRLTERPHLFSHLFLALTVLILLRSREKGAGGTVWALPPLFALWSNVHPELVLGLGYAGASVAGEWVDGRRGHPLPDPALRRRLAAVLLAGATTLLNPETYRPVAVPLSVLAAPAAVMKIPEFHRASLTAQPIFWVLGAAVVLALVTRPEVRRWSTALPLAVLFAAGVVHVRTASAFILAATPVVFAALVPAWAGGARTRRLAALAAGAAAVGALGWSLLLDRTIAYPWGHGPEYRSVPEAPARFILAHGLPPNLYNHYNEGGYLIYRLYPRMRIFEDGRGASPPEFTAAVEAPHGGGAYGQLLAEHQVMTALVHTDMLDLYRRAGDWGVVYWDDRYAVLLRRTPATEPLLSRLEYRFYLPEVRLPTERAQQIAALAEMRRNQGERFQPEAEVAIQTGAMLANLYSFGEAEVEYRRATRISPEEPRAWLGLASVLTMQGKGAEAAQAYAQGRRAGNGPLDSVRRLFRR